MCSKNPSYCLVFFLPVVRSISAPGRARCNIPSRRRSHRPRGVKLLLRPVLVSSGAVVAVRAVDKYGLAPLFLLVVLVWRTEKLCI